MEKRLYDCSLMGNTEALKSLIQEDELILDRDSLTCFNETPLHIAAMRGHSDFASLLLGLKPKLALELDSCGRSALHMASAEGHVQIVEDLLSLSLSPDLCLVRDREGRTPLHLAAMKGRVEVLRRLIQAHPKLIHDRMDRGETILHTCVRYNQLEALKMVVGLVAEGDDFINSKDDGGNTILHTAAIIKQTEITKFLLSVTSIRANANAINGNGLTSLDVLEIYPKDLETLEIRVMLIESGVRRAVELRTTTTSSERPAPLCLTIGEDNPEKEANVVPPSSFCLYWLGKARKILSKIWKAHDSRESDWVSEARGNLTVAATLTATMAFQAGINPPGGTWQDDAHGHTAGGAIQANEESGLFGFFLLFNTLSLIASMSIVLLMVSGVRLKNKYAVWILVVTMCLSVGFTALAYLFSLVMLVETVSDKEWRWYVDDIIVPVLYFWIGLCGVTIIVPLLRLFAWMINTLKFILKRQK